MSTSKTGRFINKSVLITGGSSGIGLATAAAFIREGASVAIVGRDQAALDKAVKELGTSAFGIRADVSKPADIEAMYKAFRAKHEKLDVLFANAGVVKLGAVAETSEALFDELFNTNIRGAFFTAKHALPLLNDGGAVVFTTSFFDQVGVPGTSVISATKAALRSLTRTLAAELTSRNIRVNAVSPGSIDTPIVTKLGLTEEQLQEMGKAVLQKIPAGRFGSSDEVASVVTFLASSDASYITGSEIAVDGGRLQL
jgi:NAD(P)-dependent dehydrogenase (short-subunit alcohol dehydrogenase family)